MLVIVLKSDWTTAYTEDLLYFWKIMAGMDRLAYTKESDVISLVQLS